MRKVTFEMTILFEDKDIILCEKDIGSSSEVDGSGNDIVTLLKNEVGCDVTPVNRLDKTTGGVMILAKNPKAMARMSELVQNHGIKKEYLAVVRGIPEESGVYEDLLFRDLKRNKTFVVDRNRKGVKDAKLEFVRLAIVTDEKHGDISLVRIRLHTGRTHQIRVQFSHRKMPLLGDGKYGCPDNRCVPSLWSVRTEFVHPFTGENIVCESLPKCGYPWDKFGEFLN